MLIIIGGGTLPPKNRKERKGVIPDDLKKIVIDEFQDDSGLLDDGPALSPAVEAEAKLYDDLANLPAYLANAERDEANMEGKNIKEVNPELIKGLLQDPNVPMSEKKEIADALNDYKNWRAKNPKATDAECQQKLKELKDLIDPIRRKTVARAGFNDRVNAFKDRLKSDDELANSLTPSERKLIDDALMETLDWFEANKSNLTPEELAEREKKLEEKISPIVENAEARNEFQKTIGNLKKRLNDKTDNLSSVSNEEKKILELALQKAAAFLKDKPNASKADVDAAKKEFEKTVGGMLQKYGARSDLRAYIEAQREKLKDPQFANQLSGEQFKLINSELTKALDWLNNNLKASNEDVKKKKDDLVNKIDAIMNNAEAAKNLSAAVKDLEANLADKDLMANLAPADKKTIDDLIKEAKQLLEKVAKGQASAKELEAKLKQIEQVAQPLVNSAQQRTTLQQMAEDALRLVKESNTLQKSMTPKDKQMVEQYANDTISWLKKNPKADASQINSQKKAFEKNLNGVKTFKWNVPDVKLRYLNRPTERTRWGDMSRRTKSIFYGSYMKQAERRNPNAFKAKSKPDVAPVLYTGKPNFTIKKGPKKPIPPPTKEETELFSTFDKLRQKNRTMTILPSALAAKK